jgi:outer membrane protein assembly factor BamB
MSHAEPAATPAVPPPASHRWWIPLTTLAVLAVAFVVIVLLPEPVDRGMRKIYSILSVLLALGVIAVWYFVLAGLSRRWHVAGAVFLVAAVVSPIVSIRRVEFSADMTPTFDFRWTADRFAVVEAHRAKQREASPAAREERTAAGWDLSAGPNDVLAYRGPRRDGVIDGPRLARDWSAVPPKLVWRQPVGGGYAGFVVIGPLAITIEQRRGDEAVVAYDVETGRERWIYQYPALFHETLGGDGPRATPTIHGDKLISLGATGELACLELATGKRLWQVNILTQNQSANLDWGMSGSPLVLDGQVLVTPGNQKGADTSRAITTFSLADGKPGRGGGASQAGYASPVLVELAGTKQVLVFEGQGLAGYESSDGRELWRTPWKSEFDINAAQPIVLPQDQIFITSAAGAALVKVSQGRGGAWIAEEVWRNRKLKASYGCPIAYQGYVYGLDDGILACLDLADGSQKWKAGRGRYGAGQILLCGDLLLILSEAGELALVEARPDRFSELARIQAIDGKTWNNPTLVGGRVFVRNHLEMAAYDLPLAQTETAGEQAP